MSDNVNLASYIMSSGLDFIPREHHGDLEIPSFGSIREHQPVKRPRICPGMGDYWVIHTRQVNNVYTPEPDFGPVSITSTPAVPVHPVPWTPPLSRFTVPPPPHDIRHVDTAPSWMPYPTPYPFLPFFAQHSEHYHHVENPGIDPKVL